MSEYPIVNFHFLVQWGGDSISFQEVSNLSFGVNVIEYRDGASPEYHKVKMPGQQFFDNIILKRGVFSGDTDFYKWFTTISLTKVERRDLVISVLNEEHEPVLSWKAINCFPVRLSWSNLHAGENKVLIEEIEIACEGITIMD